jgi:hypothetical protein
MSEQRLDGESSDLDRGSFLRKFVVGAFAVPAIASFKLDSLARAGTFRDHSHPDHTYGNQTEPIEKLPEQCYPNQTYANQTVPVGPPVGDPPLTESGPSGPFSGHGRRPFFHG